MYGIRTLRCIVGICLAFGLAAVATTITVPVGFTESQSGPYASLSKAQADGIRLWIEDTNASGGITLTSGDVVLFEAVFSDDQGDGARVAEAYERMIRDGVDLFISPYTSALATAAGAVTDPQGKVLVTAGAASEDTQRKGYARVYQVYTPESFYLTGAVDLLDSLVLDPGPLAFVYENTDFPSNAVAAARTLAVTYGYDVVLDQMYSVGETHFSDVAATLAVQPLVALFGGGHLSDGMALADALYNMAVRVGLKVLLVAPPSPSFADLGAAAIGVVGPSQWEPEAAYDPNVASRAELPWVGPLTADFVASYEAAHSAAPSYHAAGGYAAGLVLEQAIRQADSADPDAVAAAIEAMRIATFFGQLAFETAHDLHGLQIGHRMIYVQWQTAPDRTLRKVVVWPLEAATGEIRFSLP